MARTTSSSKNQKGSAKGTGKTGTQAIKMRAAPKKGKVTAEMNAKPKASQSRKKQFKEEQREALENILDGLTLTLIFNSGEIFKPVVPAKADYSVKTVDKEDTTVTQKLEAIVLAVKKAKATGKDPELVPEIKKNPVCPVEGCSRDFLSMSSGKSCQMHCRKHLDQPDLGKDPERTERAIKINEAIKKNKAAAAAAKKGESADEGSDSDDSDDE